MMGNSSSTTVDMVRLRAMIDEGFASGDPVEATDDFYEDVKARGRARLKASYTAS